MAATNPNNAWLLKKLTLAGDLLSVARVPNTERIFVGGYDGKIHAIDLSAEKPQPTSWTGHVSYVSGLVVAGQSVISAGSDRKMVWWDTATHRPIRTIDGAHAKWIRQLALAPDGKTIASVGDDMVCRLWDAATGKVVHELHGHPEKTRHHYRSKLFACAFSADSKLLATADQEGRIVIWETATGKQAAVCLAADFYEWDRSAEAGNAHSFGGVRSLVFSPDGQWLAAGGIDNHDAAIIAGTAMVQVFDWRTGQKTHEFKAGGNGVVESLRFHPRGEWLLGALGAGAAGKLLFYDLAGKRVIKEVVAPMLVFGVALSEAGDVIDTVGRGQVVRWGLKA